MSEVKRKMPFGRQMDVDSACEKRKHAERKAHKETQKIEIRPGHNSPRTRHSSANFVAMRELEIRDADPSLRIRTRTQFRSGEAGGRWPLRSGVSPAPPPGRSTSAKRSNSPGVRTISASSKSGVRDRKSTRLNSSHEWISYAVF